MIGLGGWGTADLSDALPHRAVVRARGRFKLEFEGVRGGRAYWGVIGRLLCANLQERVESGCPWNNCVTEEPASTMGWRSLFAGWM